MAKLTQLVGTWVAADENNQPTDEIVSVIKLTAGGSVVHVTLFPGQDQEIREKQRALATCPRIKCVCGQQMD